MNPLAGQASRVPGAQLLESIRLSGPPLTLWQWVALAVGLMLLLWVAYRIGRVILRLMVGLFFFGLLVFGIWYLFLK
jgi:hypothetical protein